MRLAEKDLFLIRLADRAGILRGPSLSQFQRWALGYLIAEEQSERFTEIFDLEKFFWAIIDRPGYDAAFAHQPDELAEGETWITPDDFADIDRWISNLDSPRTITSESFRSFS